MPTKYPHESDLQPSILLVEDDKQLANSLRQGLAESECSVVWVQTLEQARAAIRDHVVDLTVLDLGLPDGDGLELLASIRNANASLPVLILTARDEVVDRVKGLNAGADDYLTKPFAFSELIARLRALCRRGQMRKESATTLMVGDLSIDLLKRRVQRENTEITLSPLEFDVLAYLASKAGTTVSRETLIREVWKISSRASPMDNVIDVLMTRLREKVDRDFAYPLLQTIRAVGYVCKESSPI